MQEDPAQALQRRFAGKAGDFDILESVIDKARVPRLARPAFQNIGVRLELLIGVHLNDVLLDIRPVNDAISAQSLAVLHHQLRAGLAAHVQLGVAGKVLAHIEDKDAGLGLREVDGLDDSVGFDGRHHLGRELALRRLDHLRRQPVRIVVSGGVPARLLQPAS